MTVLLLAAVVYLGVSYLGLYSEFNRLNILTINSSRSEKAADFLQLFVNDVLRSDKEVDFETRLSLENAVRAVGDEEILSQWQKFINSKDETEAQANTKDLLAILAKKVANN